MKLDEFIDMCKVKERNKQEWKELKSFLCSSVMDLSTKILVSAVIEVHHPDKNIAEQYGLKSCWGKKLSAKPVSALLSMYDSSVDLKDFATAYLLAVASNQVNDSEVAEAISKFVQANKIQLGQYLNSDRVSKEEIELINSAFEGLMLTKAQKEAHFKKYFAEQAKKKVVFLQSQDQVRIDIAEIFNLAPSDFNASFSHKSDMYGNDKPYSTEGSIGFKKAISNELMMKFADTLNDLGVSSNYYNMSFCSRNGARGVQIWGEPQQIHQTLKEFSTFLATANDNSEKEASALQQQSFFKAAKSLGEFKAMDKYAPTSDNKMKL